MLEVVQVDATFLENFEQLGTKPKFWYDESRYLFKARRPESGEDWAEVVSCSLAERLGLPHAHYDLAEAVGVAHFKEPRGVRSTNFTPPGGRLVLGNELIGVVASDETGKPYFDRRQFHTPLRVAALLSFKKIKTPLNWERPSSAMTAIGVMAGYLMLDVLIGNQDRHEENWGLLVSDGAVYLAPTFDHASSLGRENRDDRRKMKFDAKNPAHGVYGYACKALSQLYASKSGSRLTTIQAFTEFSQYCKDECRYWLQQLRGIDEEYFQGIFEEVPDTHITEVGRKFGACVLVENRKRLLEVNL
ncbi:hypothetical protein [Xanthomonas arboricola]|uniref:hypothetical protein n=1 Tax=Xanthomonas arboricola TaxID=56448 RepID=UPI000CEE2257|nr:hypothetical protein [Xanthomonas arboricola]MBB6573850.1 hypothetical protein [Xanthomonas arboricola]PPT88602.1 hypothetical protein XarbCFBP8149_05615 [Xanthomonas arboricola]